MGCDSIATTISGMGKEPTTPGPEDLEGHRFSAVLAKISVCYLVLFLPESPSLQSIRRSRSVFCNILRFIQVISCVFCFLRLFSRGPTRGLMAGVARDVETILNQSGDTALLSSGESEVSLTAYVAREGNSSSNAMPDESSNNRPRSYAAVASVRTATRNATSTSRPTRYRNDQYLTNFERANFHPDNVTPERPCTAYFNADAFQDSDAVFSALQAQKFNAHAVRCLQRKPSGEMLISFATSDVKKSFVRLNSMQIGDRNYAINDGDNRLTFLNIYDVPYELPDSAIALRLEPFCEVVHMRRGRFPRNNVFNGNRHFRIRIRQPIPSYLRFGKFLVRLSHDGQDHTCRRCNRMGHFANDCPNTFCFNCEELGHKADGCPHPDRCCICKSEGHRARFCSLSWYRSSPSSSSGSPPPTRPAKTA